MRDELHLHTRWTRDLILAGFAILSLLQWIAAVPYLYGSYPWESEGARQHELWCGNVVSDPLSFLLNKHAPLAFVTLVVCEGTAISNRRWTKWNLIYSLLFLLTLTGLLREAGLLKDEFGLDAGSIWWLPRHWR